MEIEYKFNINTIEATTLSELTDKVNALLSTTRDEKVVKMYAVVVTDTCTVANKFPDNLFDKNGEKINEDDVIFDGEHFFRIYWDDENQRLEAISQTYGYLRNPDTEDYSKYERAGTFKEVERILDMLFGML